MNKKIYIIIILLVASIFLVSCNKEPKEIYLHEIITKHLYSEDISYKYTNGENKPFNISGGVYLQGLIGQLYYENRLLPLNKKSEKKYNQKNEYVTIISKIANETLTVKLFADDTIILNVNEDKYITKSEKIKYSDFTKFVDIKDLFANYDISSNGVQFIYKNESYRTTSMGYSLSEDAYYEEGSRTIDNMVSNIKENYKDGIYIDKYGNSTTVEEYTERIIKDTVSEYSKHLVIEFYKELENSSIVALSIISPLKSLNQKDLLIQDNDFNYKFVMAHNAVSYSYTIDHLYLYDNYGYAKKKKFDGRTLYLFDVSSFDEFLEKIELIVEERKIKIEEYEKYLRDKLCEKLGN